YFTNISHVIRQNTFTSLQFVSPPHRGVGRHLTARASIRRTTYSPIPSLTRGGFALLPRHTSHIKHPFVVNTSQSGQPTHQFPDSKPNVYTKITLQATDKAFPISKPQIYTKCKGGNLSATWPLITCTNWHDHLLRNISSRKVNSSCSK
ncbi:unnamed protein product, partial [Ixodes persulcatus]